MSCATEIYRKLMLKILKDNAKRMGDLPQNDQLCKIV